MPGAMLSLGGQARQARSFRQTMRMYSSSSSSSSSVATVRSAISQFRSHPPGPPRNPRISPKLRRRTFRVKEWSDPDPERTFIYAQHFKRYEMEMDALRQLAHYEEFGSLRLPPGVEAEAKSDALQESSTSDATAELLKAEEANQAWNVESGRLREAAMLRQRDAMRQAEEKRQLEEELLRRQTALSFQQSLKRDLAESAEFIDESNLDDKVEQALDSPIVGFNFAVDPAGRMVTRRQADARDESGGV